MNIKIMFRRITLTFKDCEPSKKPDARDCGCGNDTKPENGTGKCGNPPVCQTGWSGEACSKPDPTSGNSETIATVVIVKDF